MIILLSTGIELILSLFFIGLGVTALFFLIRGVLKGFKEVGLEKFFLFDGITPFKAFEKKVKREIKNSPKDNVFSLIELQIDNFSNIESNLNAQKLRDVLEQLVRRISNHMPFETTMTVFKKGGFYLYVEGYNLDEVMNFNYDLMQTLRESYLVGKKATINIPVSIAVAFFPFHGDTLNKLYKSLDILMKEIVKDGGGAVRTNQIDESLTQVDFLDYFHQIKEGIENNQFEYYYQPAINVLNDQVFSLRAYIRWNHPELGVLPANKFIKILDNSGDIYKVALHGLSIIVSQYEELKTLCNNKDLMILSFLGDKELSNPNIIKDFTGIVKKAGVNPTNIVFEIEEANLLKNDEDEITKNIQALKKLGFKVVADAFGLTPFDLEKMGPTMLDMIKLNRLFLEETDIESRNVYIKMIVNFTEKHNLPILVEQIETKEEAEIFKTLGITNIQGYLYTDALPMNEIGLWYRRFESGNGTQVSE